LTAYFPCDDGLAPCRRTVLANMASGALPWGETITHRVAWSEAASFYESVNTGAAPDVLGAVIDWS